MKEKIIKFIKYINHPHLILYGAYNIDIYKYFITIIKEYYNDTEYISYTYNQIIFNKSKYHYGFNCNGLKYNIIDFFKELFLTNIETIFYIILYNFEFIRKDIQKSLLILFEKKNNYKFVICSNNYNHIIQPLKSRCIYINIKTEYIKYDIIHDSIKYIYNNIFLKDISNIYINIKNICMLLICSNIKLSDFIIEFIDFISKKPYIINKHKHNMIKNLTKIEYTYLHSYCKIIYYEYSILSIYKNIFNSIYVYY